METLLFEEENLISLLNTVINWYLYKGGIKYDSINNISIYKDQIDDNNKWFCSIVSRRYNPNV